MNEPGSVTRILVVEDSLTQAVKLRKALQAAGFDVEVARDGELGLQTFSASRFDLVLSDVQMPRLSGYDLCRRIKADPARGNVPIILLTSLNEPTDIIRGLECGADNFINKPYEDDYLIGRIRGILAGRAARDWPDPEGPIEIALLGKRFAIASGRAQILNFFASTFEDFVRAKQGEHQGILAREKHRLEAEAYRVREELLTRESQFLQSTLDALAARISILDGSGTILAVNAAWDRHEGAGPLGGAACGVGMNYLDACGAALIDSPGDKTAIATGIGTVLAGRRPEFSLEYLCSGTTEGRWFNVRATRFGGDGPGRIVVAHEDITQRKAAEERLRHDAFHDALTGLPNRALFADRLDRAIIRARRLESTRFAVMMLDLDGFKVVNDSLGHAAGDQLLIAIAQRLGTTLRRGDSIARLGGDEFAILLEEVRDVDEAIHLAGRVQEGLRPSFRIEGHEVFAAASIGIVPVAKCYDRPEEVLRDADTAMYHAKATGRGRFAVFDRVMHTRILARLELEADLRRAVDRGELRAHYQPIVSLETGRIAGLEALVRWEHPGRGLLGPQDFVPLAEETGAILPLGLWVLREACGQMQAWRSSLPAAESLIVSVNLSGRQLAQPGLVEQVDEVLRATGLDPRGLSLEVTESVAMGDAETAIAVLGRLRNLGIRLSLDDFGTGYSSLSHLHRFPLDTLKVDRSFVNRMGGESGGSGIVRTILTLGHSLGMDVVAEGVETAEQVALLRGLGCRFGQGYFFSRPLGREAAEALLASGPYLIPPRTAQAAAAPSPEPGVFAENWAGVGPLR